MKYDKKDLMNEGWKAMESLLNEEMPSQSKSNNYVLVSLFVCIAFGLGFLFGTQIEDKNANVSIDTDSTSPNVALAKFYKSFENTTEIKPLHKVLNRILPERKKIKSSDKHFVSNGIADQQALDSNKKIGSEVKKDNEIFINSEGLTLSNDNVVVREKINQEFLSQVGQSSLQSNGLSTTYLPRLSGKYKKSTNWILALSLSSGINPSRDTKVASLKSEWLYRIGNNSAVGLEFIYAAEDKFGFLNFGETPVETPSRNKPSTEQGGRENVEALIQNSRQFRYAAGLVYQLNLGERFYSNISGGFNIMQNSYSNELAYKSLNTIEDIRYHWGGYTSLAIGYRISKLVDFEISGTKSLLHTESRAFERGDTDHIVGGLKISF